MGWFCGTCGAEVFIWGVAEEVWYLCTGLWDRTEGLITWTGCKYLEGSVDGGASVWFGDIADENCEGGKRELKVWKRNDTGDDVELIDHSDPNKFALPGKLESDGEGGEKQIQDASPEAEERLPASCHCGGVQFYITRPNAASNKAYSPFPDLMVPYNSGLSDANPHCEPWFIRGPKKDKYLAGACVCPSCRVALGLEIQTWAFIPKCNIFSVDGKPLDYGNLGTLKQYDSSEGVYRQFCGTCGAKVFWHCDVRPEVVDIGVGVLGGKGISVGGMRRGDWLEWWTERVSFRELGTSGKLIDSLEEGLRAWGRKQNLAEGIEGKDQM